MIVFTVRAYSDDPYYYPDLLLDIYATKKLAKARVKLERDNGWLHCCYEYEVEKRYIISSEGAK